MQRNFSIDIIKSVAALLVICIHTGYPSVVGDYVVAFCRVAVPLFLLISGYYYQVIIERKRILSYYKKILILTIISSVFYFIANGIDLNYLKVFRWDKMLMFSFPITGDHLWYLYSLINVLVVLAICYKIRNKLFYLIPFLLLCNYILSFSPKFWLYRNFLFTSLPYFLLGMYFYNHTDSVKTLFKNKNHCILIFITSIILLCFELYSYKQFDLIYVRDHYLTTPILVVMIFGYALSVNLQKENVVSVIGKRYSAYIYVLHNFVCGSLISLFDIGCSCLSYIKPLIVFLLTLFMVVIILRIYNLLKKCLVSIRKSCAFVLLALWQQAFIMEYICC